MISFVTNIVCLVVAWFVISESYKTKKIYYKGDLFLNEKDSKKIILKENEVLEKIGFDTFIL